ncbi:hypothetical protein F5I97DRAFT_1933830 [Phlebopus sp. FC_14]|nr:hypothetical protein F5I97DRAFT_1933830 [Phlebopus sp. FC_14]
MVYAVPLIIFMDDQWNKHHAINKEFCICFVTSSPHAMPMELMSAMRDSEEEVLLIPYGLFVGSDNPMQVKECSHAGLNCNYFCRTCHVGGMKEYKMSNKGYNSLFVISEPQMVEQTAATIKEQIHISMVSGATEKVKKSTTSTGIWDTTTITMIEAFTNLRKQLSSFEKSLKEMLHGNTIHESINPLLGMQGILDIHMDTSMEILHTVLLDVVKYFWGQTVFLLKKAKLLGIFQNRLDSVDKDGLNLPLLNADYICHYKSSLIRKHFICLAQIMPFLIYDLIPKTVLDGWTAIGKLVVLIWHTEITDMEEYLATLTCLHSTFWTWYHFLN